MSAKPRAQDVGRMDGARPLDRIPLVGRMIVYGAAFLFMVLVALPHAASRVDGLIPAWQFQLPTAVRIAGGVFFAATLIGYCACSLHLVMRGRGAYVEFDPPKEFVSSGPFRWCRNPVAGFVVLMVLGEAIMLSSIGILLLFIVAMPLAHLQVVLMEEPLLRKRFGESYEAYLRSVPRWLPRPPRERAS